MNIFKVFASGGHTFTEKSISTFLSWLLNPIMEHGLGYSFLLSFLDRLSESIDITAEKKKELKRLLVDLDHSLRNQDESKLDWFSFPEYPVGGAMIDIVVKVNDWIFSIENKIYLRSVKSTKDQLETQYAGLKKHDDFRQKKIGLIFLVPIKEHEQEIDEGPIHPDPKIQEEFNRVSVQPTDFKAIVTWQKNSIQRPSISEIIEKALIDELHGEIDPIPVNTRHTLKALNSFICSNFEGYKEEKLSSNGMNKKTCGQLTINDLLTKEEGFVGVKGGLKGLLNMTESQRKNHSFQYATDDMSEERFWIKIEDFKNIIRWLDHGEKPDINWEGYFPFKWIHKIARDYGQSVFIGLKGGRKKLLEMSYDEVQNREFKITSDLRYSSNPSYLDGFKFCQVYEAKYDYET